MRLPSSSSLPSPAARTLPFCGFSLAVSGRTRPLAVVSSSSTARTIKRSPRGLSFILKNLHLENASDFDAPAPGLGRGPLAPLALSDESANHLSASIYKDRALFQAPLAVTGPTASGLARALQFCAPPKPLIASVM